MAYKHVILDRDGVLNYEAPDSGYVREPEEFRWLPGSLEALALLTRAGLRLTVATNQSGVGRGIMTLAQLTAVHDRMLTEAAAGGAAIDAVLFCPHAPGDGCSCRKPEPGLIHEAISRSGIAAQESLVVGDAQRDLDAGARAGVRAVLVRTGKGIKTEATLHGTEIAVYEDLSRLAHELVSSGCEDEDAD
jgi:D-glycero-D-manno-heptose 1,7-bisphosphate phosphatase